MIKYVLDIIISNYLKLILIFLTFQSLTGRIRLFAETDCLTFLIVLICNMVLIRLLYLK